MKVLNAKPIPKRKDPFAELKAAHARGEQIQYYSSFLFCEWVDVENPIWDPETKYRIKPGYRCSYRAYERKLKNSFNGKLLPVVCVCMDKEIEEKIEGLTGFVKWLEPWKDVYEEAE